MSEVNQENNRDKAGPGGQAAGGDDGDKRRFAPRGRFRKRVLDTRKLEIDYKQPDILERFISKTGKILPRRMTGATASVQRKISREIKKARMLNLLPFTRR